MNDSIARAKFIDKLMTAVFYCVAGFFILLLVAFALYVIINGFKDFSWSLISFEGSGIGNLFFNTIYLVFLSLLVSVPLGVAAGIYMAEYAKQGTFTKFLRMCIETMSSLPSIVVGLFGYLVFIVMTGSHWNLLSPTCPLNPFRPGETLALHIWASRTEALAANAAQMANLSSAILMLLVLSFSLGARYLSTYLDTKTGGSRK